MNVGQIWAVPLQGKVIHESLLHPPAAIKVEHSDIKFQLMLIQDLTERFEPKIKLCTYASSTKRNTQYLAT